MAKRKKRDPQFGYDAGTPWASLRTIRQTKFERQMWFSWRDAHPDAGEEIWYDIHLPRNIAHAPPYYDRLPMHNERKWLNMWEHLTVLRADVVYRRGDTYRVVEMRANPTDTTLHKLLLYDKLLRAHWPDKKFATPILLCTFLRPSIRIAPHFLPLIVYEQNLIFAPENRYFVPLYCTVSPTDKTRVEFRAESVPATGGAGLVTYYRPTQPCYRYIKHEEALLWTATIPD